MISGPTKGPDVNSIQERMTDYNTFYSLKSQSRFWIKKISVPLHISWRATHLYSRKKLWQLSSRDNWSPSFMYSIHLYRPLNTPFFLSSLPVPFLSRQVPGKLLLWSHRIHIYIYNCLLLLFFPFSSQLVLIPVVIFPIFSFHVYIS